MVQLQYPINTYDRVMAELRLIPHSNVVAAISPGHPPQFFVVSSEDGCMVALAPGTIDPENMHLVRAIWSWHGPVVP